MDPVSMNNLIVDPGLTEINDVLIKPNLNPPRWSSGRGPSIHMDRFADRRI